MKKLVRFAAKFYPLSWRQRYGAEFDALLDDSRSGWRDVLDVLCGALMMRISMGSYWNMSVAFGLGGLILAAGFALRMPNHYVSHGVVRINWLAKGGKAAQAPTALPDGNTRTEEMKAFADEAFSRDSLAAIIKRPDLDLYKGERTREPLEDVIEKMRNAINIEPLKGDSSSTNFKVSFEYRDPVVAQKTVNVLIQRLMNAGVELVHAAASNRETFPNKTMEVLEIGSVSQKPSYPNRLQIAFTGLGMGAIAGILIATFRRKSAA